MKKILAAALAVVMVLSMSVMAFAAPTESWQKVDSEGVATPAADSQTEIITSTQKLDDEGNPVDAAYYTVIIPASTTIYWEEESTDVMFWVDSQLGPNTGVNVTVADADAAYVMTNAALEDQLAYTLNNGTPVSITTDYPVMKSAEYSFTVDVAMEQWQNATIAEYSDILTFTAGTTAIA